MKLTPLILLIAACSAISPVALRAADAAPAKAKAAATLEAGSKAPEFKPTAWVQGEPVTAFEKGKTYLIECWATWCVPCIAQIPHLNALQKKYADKGLVIIGTNVWDKDAANAAAFVKGKGEGMSYRIAFDDKATGLFTRDWLNAAGITAIPRGIVVRDGLVIWIGHPATLKDEALESMLAGTFDFAKAAAEQKAEAKTASAGKSKAKIILESVAELIKAKDYDGAYQKVGELGALDDHYKPVVLVKRVEILADKADFAGAVKLAKDGVKQNPAMVLKFNLANSVLQSKAFSADKDGIALAVELADAMTADPQHGADAVVGTVAARAHYLAGDKAGSLAKLAAIAALPDTDDRVKSSKALAAKCAEAVKAGEAWPQPSR